MKRATRRERSIKTKQDTPLSEAEAMLAVGLAGSAAGSSIGHVVGRAGRQTDDPVDRHPRRPAGVGAGQASCRGV